MATLGAGAARADCNVFPFRYAQPVVERFVMRPETLMRDYPDGGSRLATAVAMIATSSKAALPLLLRVSRTMDPKLEIDFANGLAEASKMCETRDGAHARRIQSGVQKTANFSLRKAFDRASSSAAEDDARLRAARLAESQRRIAVKPPESGNLFFDRVDPRAPIRALDSGIGVRPLGPIAPIGPNR